MYRSFAAFFLPFAIAWTSFGLHNNSQTNDESLKETYIKGQVLVKVKSESQRKAERQLGQKFGAKLARDSSLVEGLALFRFDPNIDVMQVISELYTKDYVIYAEPDYVFEFTIDDGKTNDSEFAKQWSLENTGQNQGKKDADINAEFMWQQQKGQKNIVLAISDTGVDYNHLDLASNIWQNQNEIADNQKDDDNNGYIDDIHGINAIKNDGNPNDDHGHGTHVAGIIGAIGNNEIGISGVAQSIEMVTCKFLSQSGFGSTSDAIRCMEYFAQLKTREINPVNIVATNNSWGGGNKSEALLDAIKEHEKLGILFVAAAGNQNSNNDLVESYPANYDAENVISVAATDNNDRLASFSNFGVKTVDVAAFGVKILSTYPSNNYHELSGTSMAAPHVTGLIGVIASEFLDINAFQIRNLILTGGEKIESTKNTTISGRRIRGADENGVGSLTCENQILVARKKPEKNSYTLNLKETLFLSALHLNCDEGAGPLTLYQDEETNITLQDDGQNGDLVANDGIYSLLWTADIEKTFELKFSDTDIVTITVQKESESTPLRSHAGRLVTRPLPPAM